MSGRQSARKGAEGERELARLLEAEGYQIRRDGTQTYGSVPDLMGLEGVHIEVKRKERLNLSEAMHQAERDSEKFKDGSPTVFHRRNHENWYVTMRLSDWLTLYREAKR